MNRLFHVDGKQNIADTGTRSEDLKIEDFCPGSEWELGKPWMKLEVKEAEEKGIIKPVEMINKACSRLVFGQVTRRTRWPRIIGSCENLRGYPHTRYIANCAKNL